MPNPTVAVPSADRNIAKFDDAKRGLAKLMARENISVQILDGTPTAKFDVVQRVLTLPNWPNLNVDQTDTLIGHEIGHALFTDHSYLEIFRQRQEAKKQSANLFGYVNVIEDARIERKIRDIYPGMKSVFYGGYKTFTERGPLLKVTDRTHVMFGERTLNVARMSLIDRINLHYKIGVFIDVPFKPEEHIWIDRIDRCYSTTNACEIAIELYEADKQKEKEKREEQKRRAAEKAKSGEKPKSRKAEPGETGDEEGEGEYGDGDEDGEEGESDSPSKDSKSKGKKSKSKPKAKPEADEADDEDFDGDAGDDGDDEKSDDKKKKSGKSSKDDEDTDEDDEDDSKKKGGKKSDKDDDDDDTDSDDADGDDTDDEDTDDDSDSGSGSGDSDGDDESDDEGDGDGDSDEDGDGDGDGDSDDAGETGDKSSPNASNASPDNVTPEPEPPDPASETEEALAKGLQSLVEQQKGDASVQIKHLLLKPMDSTEVAKRTVSAAEWVKRCEAALSANNTVPTTLENKLKAMEAEWNSRYLATAKHMAAEFQRKKTAKNLMNARTGRTGRLDVNRLHSYKFADDLFKRVMTVPNGQSHGIVMVIDGSSSMSGVFGNVLDQVLLFANFAFICNIPFEAYMFTDRSSLGDKMLTMTTAGLQTVTVPGAGRLVGLVNTTTDRSGFKRQVRMVLTFRGFFLHDEIQTGSPGMVNTAGFPYASLGGTPLYAGMMLMDAHVGRMKRTLKLDKVMGIVISDGGDTNKLFYETANLNKSTGLVETTFPALGDTAFVVRDTVTKKNHVFVEKNYSGKYIAPKNSALTMLFNVMHDRYDARNIFIFLVDTTNSYGVGGVVMAANTMMRAGQPQLNETLASSDIRKQIDANGQYIVKNGAADCNLVLVGDSLKLAENEFAKVNTAGMSSERIGEAFISSAKRAMANRVFTNSVMPYLI